MISNIERYRSDLMNLVTKGDNLLKSMLIECNPIESEEAIKKHFKTAEDIVPFNDNYQDWYSEARAVLSVLLPSRINDFIKLYEKPKGRKYLSHENYVIEDYLQGLQLMRSGELTLIRDKSAAIPQFQQQLNIFKSVVRRFESSLFDIKQLIQADLFDSELESAKELERKGFFRGAGAVAGVILEKHLSQVCHNHDIKITKKEPTISDYNEKLKQEGIYEIPIWRMIQHLGDLRNLCDHNKKKEPTTEDIDELIKGVERIIKTIY